MQLSSSNLKSVPKTFLRYRNALSTTPRNLVDVRLHLTGLRLSLQHANGQGSGDLARSLSTYRRNSSPNKIRYFTFSIFTILPFACASLGSFTTVTYNSFSPSPNATFVVPSPAAISNMCRSLPSGEIFKILPPNHWAT